MADRYEPTEEHFLRNVDKHELKILLNQGVYRHLDFSRGNSWNMRFTLTTWPGHLAINGGVASYVFARTYDMFEFFRHDIRHYAINPHYWAEKLQATDTRSKGHKEFSLKLFEQAVRDDFDRWRFESDEKKAEAWSAIDDDFDGLIGRFADYQGDAAIREAMDWKCPVTGQRFTDFWDHTFDDWTYHYIWCCRAITWGITQFDAATSEVGKAEAVPA